MVARVALVVAGTLVGVMALELVVRVYEYAQETRQIAAWQRLRDDQVTRNTGEAPLGEMIRVAADPDIIYEMVPNLTGVTHRGQPVEINADGFRGPSYPRRAAPGTVRIVGIGDSVMFGWGVREEESYLRVLERRLNGAGPGRRIEIVNTAVPGYNTAMEVATLERKGLAFEPDLVIIGFVGNDLRLPNFIARRQSYWSGQRSFLLDRLLSRRERDRLDQAGWLVRAPRADATGTFLDDPDRVPRLYRHMVGESGYRRAMQRLARLSEEHAFDVLVLTTRSSPELVRRVATELELELLSTAPQVRRYMREHGITQSLGSELTISETDAHPSAVQHRLIADALHERLLGRLASLPAL